MKGFFIEVSNDLLDPKHCKRMGDAVWLFMWLLDKITVINAKNGKVLGGKPIKYKDIVTDLGISRSTYMRWMKTLKDGDYVETVRTPAGVCIVVKKAKKRFNRPTTDVSEVAHQCVKNDTSVCVKSDTSVCVKSDTSMCHNRTSMSDYDTSNIDRAFNNTEYIQPPTPSGIGGRSFLGGEKEKSFTSKIRELKKFNDIGEIPEKLVGEAIALFLPVFPELFVNKNPFAMMPTRNAVKRVLMEISLEELKTIVDKYLAGKENRFRPDASNIWTFCGPKFAKIKAFAGKSQTGLYAHKPISTPEESKILDKQYKQKIEENREKQRKFKEEWDKEHPVK